MWLRKEGFPEDDELVMCTVTKVHFNSVFVSLDEFQRPGMIHISEISPGRIRNIRDFVKEGKVIVCKVLRVNKELNQIDLSLRRVNDAQRRAKVEEMKQEQKAEKIVEYIAGQLKQDPLTLYKDVFAKVRPSYEMLNHAFSAVVEESVSLEKMGIDKKIAKALEDEIIHRIKPSEVQMHATMSLKTYEPDGVEVIKQTLQKTQAVSDSIAIKYLGAGKYHVVITAPDFPEAEDLLEKAAKAASDFAEAHHTTFSYEKEKAA